MRNFFREIWNVVRLFPLVSYGIFMLLVLCLIELTNSFQVLESLMPGLPLALFLFYYPLQLTTDLMTFLGFKWLLNLFDLSLVGTCFFLLLLDLLLLSLRTGFLKNFLTNICKKTHSKLCKNRHPHKPKK